MVSQDYQMLSSSITHPIQCCGIMFFRYVGTPRGSQQSPEANFTNSGQWHTQEFFLEGGFNPGIFFLMTEDRENRYLGAVAP
jgi:hypothetical protein